MYGRAGLDRFKKAQSLEPFQVTLSSSPGTTVANQSTSKAAAIVPKSSPVQYPQAPKANPQTQIRSQAHDSQKLAIQEAAPLLGQTNLTQIGGGQSTWQPPDWAIEPRPGVYYLEVMKDGEVLDRISLDRRRQIFGRQIPTCDFVLDHQSVSRQHAAVIPHKNGSIYVIDLGSAHGTFVANERLTKDTPMELEVGQSLKFAASTRTYILRKNNAALFPPTAIPAEINLPPPPDPSDEEAIVAYNTLVNRYCLGKAISNCSRAELQRPAKRARKQRVTFRDHAGEKLAEVVGMSDGADVGTEPGPIGVKEGSLVGKYESLVQTTVIPKGKEQQTPVKEDSRGQKGVTDRLQQVLDKVKNPKTKGGIYDDLYGDSLKVGSSWAFPQNPDSAKATSNDPSNAGNSNHGDDEDDDLFGD